MVVVYRWDSNQPTFLVLHRGQFGPDFDGEWAWRCQEAARRGRMAATKRRVIEPTRQLPEQKLAERVCDALGCPYHDHIPIPEQVA